MKKRNKDSIPEQSKKTFFLVSRFNCSDYNRKGFTWIDYHVTQLTSL